MTNSNQKKQKTWVVTTSIDKNPRFQLFSCDVKSGPKPEDSIFGKMYFNENGSNPTAQAEFKKAIQAEVGNSFFKQGDRFHWNGKFYDSFHDVVTAIIGAHAL